MAHFDENSARNAGAGEGNSRTYDDDSSYVIWDIDGVGEPSCYGVLPPPVGYDSMTKGWKEAIKDSPTAQAWLQHLNNLFYGKKGGHEHFNPTTWGRETYWCLMQIMGPIAAKGSDHPDGENYGRSDYGEDIKYDMDFRLEEFIDANGQHIEPHGSESTTDFRRIYTSNTDWTEGDIGKNCDWVYLYGALEYIKIYKYTEFDRDHIIGENAGGDGHGHGNLINYGGGAFSVPHDNRQIRHHFSSYPALIDDSGFDVIDPLTGESPTPFNKNSCAADDRWGIPGHTTYLCDEAQFLIRRIIQTAGAGPSFSDGTTGSQYTTNAMSHDELHELLTQPFVAEVTYDVVEVFEPGLGVTVGDAADLGLDDTPQWGIPEEEYDQLVEEGLAIVPCDDPPVEVPPEECPACEEDPEAVVPDWRYKEEGDVFLNGRTCEYCVTVNTGEIDATILNDTATREAFLAEQVTRGVGLVLEFFGKDNVTADTLAVLEAEAIAKQYDVPTRPLMPVRVLVCIPVDYIDAIQIIDTSEPEAPPIGPIGCVLKAPEIRTMVKQVREGFRYYGHRYALWSWDTGQVIPNFDPKEEGKKLKRFVPALVQLMNRNGFKLNGKNAAEKVEFRFNKKYELIYAQANEVRCEPVELLWKKDGDNLGGFKELDPINDPRTMGYVAALNDMYVDANARDPKGWDEFFAKYTYPSISVYLEDVPDPLGDPVMADGPIQQAAQSIVDDIVSLPDALVAKFGDAVCRDRMGQATHVAQTEDFDERLKRALYMKNQWLQVGDDTFLNLPELLSGVSSLDELYSNVLNKLKRCGLLDLLGMAMACLTNGLDLADSLSVIVKSALKAMDPGNLEKLFIGLPSEAQLEIKDKIAEEFGSMPAPWEAGYRPGSYSYKVDLNDDGNPIGEEHTVTNPDGTVETIPAESDNRSVAERTASYRMETQGTEFGGAGTVGTAADNVMDAIFEAYIEAIMDSVDAEYLLEQLNKFPGAELITKALLNPECPPPPLFNPPLGDFMKTLELDFCRGNFDITWPKFQKINIPDLWKMFMDALMEVLIQLAIKIIMTILEMILKLLLNGLCNLLGLLGDAVAGLFANQPTNNFADSIKGAATGTGLDALGVPIPLADDEAVNAAAANLFASFSRSCTDPEDLPTSEEASEFMKEIGLVLTQGEFIDLLQGMGAEEVYRAVYQLVLIRHQSFLCIFPNISSIKSFFGSLGDMIDPDFMTRGQRGQPVFPSVCSDVTGSKEIDDLRRQLLQNQELNEELIEQQLEWLKCQALSDLEDLAKFANEGLSMPPLMGDECNPGIIPRDPSADVLPQGPLGVLQGPFGLFEGSFDIMDKMYYKDLMGRGGFLNMVLSDKDGRSRRSHDAFVAFSALFGIFSIRPNSHQDLLPETVAKYLEWVLKNPDSEMVNNAKFLHQPFTPSADPDLKLKYSNYFPGAEDEWYRFTINFTASDYDSSVLNNRYRIVLDETFNYTKDPSLEEDPSGTFKERLVIDTDPGMPDGVQEFIEEELGLDIETTLNAGTPEGTPASELSAQAVVFGKYIEKILKDATPDEALSHPDGVALDSLSYIADACMTDMFNYVYMTLFSFIAGTIGEKNMAFDYGEGGSAFDKNTPNTYGPTKIFLDGSHKYPPEHPLAGQALPLDPLAWGGNEDFPAYYNRPAQNRPGWCGIADKMIPEVDACDPKRENIIGFKQISDEATDFYQKISDDERLNQPSTCPIEEPCNKILTRAAAAMIEGNIRSTIRIYAAEAFLKGMPAFLKFKIDLNELYSDPIAAYITETMKSGFYLYSKKGFGRRRNDEYYFQFLEQCVQNFGRKIDAGLLEATTEEQEALDTINALQAIWKKDTDPGSGKAYAGTGEKLKRVLSPGFLGTQIMNTVKGNRDTASATLSAKEAEKLKAEAWDEFMREIKDQAEVITKRYIADELKYISDEFTQRIPPEYRTLYEILLGHDTFGCWGGISVENSVPTGLPHGDGWSTFAVAANALETDPDEDGIPNSALTGETMNLLYYYADPTAPPVTTHVPMDRPNPASEDTRPPSEDLKQVYWPFALEHYVEIEDYTADHWQNLAESGVDLEAKYGPLAVSGAPEIWHDILGRHESLYGVVRVTEWDAYLQSEAATLAGFTRADLWKSWSYGLRIIFIPPNGTESPRYDSDGDPIPNTGITMPKSVDIKYKIQDWAPYSPSLMPFSSTTIQQNKAFYFTPTAHKSMPIENNPMSIPLAKGSLPMPMDISCLDSGWTTSYDEAGGFAALVQDLVCSDEYKMLFRYCFNMPRILSVIGIYIIQAFLPSIGKAGEADTPELNPDELDKSLTIPEGGEDNDGWYEPHVQFRGDDEYYGGGLSLFPTALNFKRWNFYKAFPRTKKLAAQSFMDLYNSENPNYKSDAYSDTSIQDDAKKGLTVSWPKFSIRLWSKEVDRPYDMNGDLCFVPEDDYSD